jgi:hypothetical protein
LAPEKHRILETNKGDESWLYDDGKAGNKNSGGKGKKAGQENMINIEIKSTPTTTGRGKPKKREKLPMPPPHSVQLDVTKGADSFYLVELRLIIAYIVFKLVLVGASTYYYWFCDVEWEPDTRHCCVQGNSRVNCPPGVFITRKENPEPIVNASERFLRWY